MIWADKNEETTCHVPTSLILLGLPVTIGTPPPNQPRFDYIINDAVAVERKTVPDYFQSKASKHLDTQLYDMSTNFSLSFVVIVGTEEYPTIQSYLSKNSIPPQNWYGTYIGTQIKVSPDGKQGTVIINEVPDVVDFILYLKTLHDKFEEGNFTRLPQYVKTTTSNEERGVANLCTLPNIGPLKARAILEQYGSLARAYEYFIEHGKWEIKGIGEITLKKANDVLFHGYGSEQNGI